ncbi:MAG: hypothetical protein IID43_07190 [Planctomycetes bacterium]|nr:hypothetical protein [Planctomycetota bacterium]
MGNSCPRQRCCQAPARFRADVGRSSFATEAAETGDEACRPRRRHRPFRFHHFPRRPSPPLPHPKTLAPIAAEIVLDQPIPIGEHTRFIFNDGTTVNVVDYTYVLGDANGDGGIDLFDVAVLQNCFGESNPTDWCRAFDFNNDQTIDLTDYAMLVSLLQAPQP